MDEHLKPGDPFVWAVDVLDPFGRPRELLIGARDGRVVMLLPAPGDGCSMTPDNADIFSAQVKAAGERASMQQ